MEKRELFKKELLEEEKFKLCMKGGILQRHCISGWHHMWQKQ
jgi:hypothetical protein